MRTRQETEAAMVALRHFIGPAQKRILGAAAARGEEREWFREKLCTLAALMEAMPKTHEQDGKGEQAVASLHYFASGQASWWITEKDAGSADDAPEDKGRQLQAFGLADLFQDGGEVGYISIAEILENGGELDLYFRPCTLAEVCAGRTTCGEPATA